MFLHCNFFTADLLQVPGRTLADCPSSCHGVLGSGDCMVPESQGSTLKGGTYSVPTVLQQGHTSRVAVAAGLRIKPLIFMRDFLSAKCWLQCGKKKKQKTKTKQIPTPNHENTKQ